MAFVKALNVFQYVTFRTAYASITALLLSLLFGGKLIEALKSWNIGQQIREEGPQAHMAKRGTPTMGGVLIVGSVVISTLLWARLSSVYVWTIVIATMAFGAIGFADDYVKMAKRRSLGLTGRQKLLLQVADRHRRLGRAIIITTKYFASDYSWNVSIPFFKATADPDGISLIRSDPVSDFHRYRVAGIVERGESDGRFGWTGDQRDLHRDDGADGVDLSEQRRASGRAYLELTHRPRSGGADGFLRRDGGRESRVPLVQRAAG